MLRKAGVRLSDIALRASGRFSVMMATRSRITQSNSSVPVSILVSVVMLLPYVDPSFRGRCGSIEPGISRFSGAQLRTVVRIFDAPRNDGLV